MQIFARVVYKVLFINYLVVISQPNNHCSLFSTGHLKHPPKMGCEPALEITRLTIANMRALMR